MPAIPITANETGPMTSVDSSANRAPAARTPGFVWLASQSPRRQELLRQIGVRFELLAPGPEEDAEALEAFRVGESPTQYVERVVLAKAAAASERLVRRHGEPESGRAAPILVADTTVAIGGRMLGKPADDGEARAMLEALSGRGHRVLTAVAVARGGRLEHTISVSRVRFERLSPAVIDIYVASREPFGKAGGYGIQGMAAAFVRRIEGSYSGIMGLPLHETAKLLKRAGLPWGADTR
jgi:septum formation protein